MYTTDLKDPNQRSSQWSVNAHLGNTYASGFINQEAFQRWSRINPTDGQPAKQNVVQKRTEKEIDEAGDEAVRKLPLDL
jgi:hypothetical protein